MPGNLIGHHVSYFRVGTTDFARPDPDPSANISVLVPQPGGTFTSRAVSNTGDGGFRIDGLDGGEVYVRFTNGTQLNYYVTANTFINLDDYTLGRPGPLAADSTATITAGNMLLTDAPDFQVVAPNTGFSAFAFPDALPAAPTTSLLDEPSQLSVLAGGFPDGTAGDPAWLLQTQPFDAGDLDALSTDGGTFYVYATSTMRAAPLTGLRLGPDGGSISGVFQNATTTEAVQLTIGGDWSAHFGEMVDGGGYLPTLAASVFPAPNAPGLSPQWVGYSGMLADFYGDAPPSQFSLLMPYVNPYPPEWKLVLVVSAINSQRTRLPGTTSGSVSASLNDSRLVTAVAAPLPRVLPPRITVEGSNGTFASLTPQISWQAGAGMTPNAWTISVIRLSVSGTATVRSTVATVFTSGASARLPPGVLVSGQTYVLRVTAVLVPGEDLLTTPYLLYGAFDEATASTLTGMWRAP